MPRATNPTLFHLNFGFFPKLTFDTRAERRIVGVIYSKPQALIGLSPQAPRIETLTFGGTDIAKRLEM